MRADFASGASTQTGFRAPQSYDMKFVIFLAKFFCTQPTQAMPTPAQTPLARLIHNGAPAYRPLRWWRWHPFLPSTFCLKACTMYLSTAAPRTTAPRSWRTHVRTAVLASVLPFTLGSASTAASAQDGPQLNLPRVELTAGMHRIDAQVAQAQQERQTGLMHRQNMPLHEGMLFVFEQPATQCFWMKNTLLPLSTAFVADDGTIVNLADMQPQTLDSHCSTKPVRYVLEMNQGWFSHKGIKAGFKLSGAPFKR